MNKIDSLMERISYWFEWIALAALTAMLILVTLDILGGKILSRPVPGAMDLTSLLSLLIIGFSMPGAYRKGRHIKVDFVAVLLHKRILKVTRFFSFSLCWLFFFFITWRMFLYAHDLLEYGEKSLTVKIPLYPFGYALSVAFLPLLVIVPLKLVKLCKRSGE